MHKLWEVIIDGAPFTFVNLVVLAVSLAMITERAIFLLFQGQINSKGLFDQLQKLIRANNVDRAIRLCGSRNAPVLRVAKAGLVQVHRGEEAISVAMEEALVDTLPDVKKRIANLWSLANIATLIGLLGTVAGLIRAFGAIATASPEERQAVLARGISEAMYNTAMGLGIAIICIIGHLLLGNQSKKLAAEVEGFSLKLENFLIVQARSTEKGPSVPPR